MEIVFVASEAAPFAKTGGLADVIGSLPQAVAKLGHHVSVFLPNYRRIREQRFPLELAIDRLQIPLASDTEAAAVFTCREEEVTFFFIGHAEYFDRDELYGTPMGDYPDNDRRFTFFQRAVLESLKRLKIKPEIIHCHDWQTALIPVYLKTVYQADPFYKKTKSFLTVHNLSYQGNFPPDSLSITGLSWEEFRFERLEFYGKVSFLKGGLVYADAVTTVSERYSREIQTREFGCGMDQVLASRKQNLFGVVNGIDPNDWDPEKDFDIAANYGARNLKKKKICKETLQKENHLTADPKVPLFCFIGRLADQKGLDILAPVVERIAQENWQLVLLGTGEERYHHLLRSLGKRYPEHLSINITFDLKMAKRIYSGADIYLMPSRFEPCGLGQIISFRFGTVPVVRETGGLADTVEDFDPLTGKGNGFVFSNYSADDLFEAMHTAIDAYRDPKAWGRLMKSGMAQDFSWRASASRYVTLYEQAERKQLKV